MINQYVIHCKITTESVGKQGYLASQASYEGSIPFARSSFPPPQLVLFADLDEIKRVDRRHSLGLRLFESPLQLLGAGAA
jgi:hypothetical protein